MTLRRLIKTLFPLLLIIGMTQGRADPVTFSFTGSVTDDPFGLSIFGAPIEGTYTFDSDATDAIADPSTGSYASVGPGFNFSVTVDGTTYAVVGSVTVTTANNIGVDQYGVIGDDGSLILEIFFEDATQAALSSDSLPTGPPAVANFAFRQSRVFGAEVEFLGTIESLLCTVGCDGNGGGGTVSEPVSAWLVGIGLAGLLLRRRIAAVTDGTFLSR